MAHDGSILIGSALAAPRQRSDSGPNRSRIGTEPTRNDPGSTCHRPKDLVYYWWLITSPLYVKIQGLAHSGILYKTLVFNPRGCL